ncbi:MAG: hypothetical protein ACK41C_12775 [Phenylobacterium sp.]|jgi:hypothetical protein|uniref:hypothetical protein n=1 Tax=Phenylobacterium sp. TaxID=1871053 RepID=UPI00391D55D5
MQTQDATELAAREMLRADPELAEAEAAVEAAEPAESEEDAVEIEHDGRFYRIPAALKGAFLMNADYTRKTQDLAEHRRTLEAQRRNFERNAELVHATAADRARLALLDEQLADFEGMDWEAFADQDPRSAEALWARYRQLAEGRERYAWSLARLEDESRLAAERDLAEQMAETGRVLAREIDGWSPEVAAKLVEYAAAFGVTLEELRQVADPRLWKILHKAHLGEQIAKEREAAKQAAQVQAVRPAAQVGGGQGGGAAVRDELGTKEWMRRRNEQATRGR